MAGIRNVVLVHGGFVDGSGWQGVYDLLKADGFTVSVAQNPTISLEGDVAGTKMVLDAQDGPAILVGHSYGGAVITEAGTHEKVAALVYISAFAPDKEESVNTLISGFPSGGRYRRSCRPRMGSCFSIAESSRHHSQLICPRSNRRSWPNRRSHGASTPYPKRSRTQLGGRSRAGISSPPTTT
jgi:pimeloyl-ACP methyl ester carboxylesterase